VKAERNREIYYQKISEAHPILSKGIKIFGLHRITTEYFGIWDLGFGIWDLGIIYVPKSDIRIPNFHE
jgi:hypothetical protein